MILLRLFFLAASPTVGPPAPGISPPPIGSSPPPMSASPPFSSVSFAVFRTSFHERNVLRRAVLAMSLRIRKKRSTTPILREPRRMAVSLHWVSLLMLSVCLPKASPQKRTLTHNFHDLLPDNLLDNTSSFWTWFTSLTRHKHHLPQSRVSYHIIINIRGSGQAS